jgi:hypothetical protein
MKKTIALLIIFLMIKPILGQRIAENFIESTAYISYSVKKDSTSYLYSGSGFFIFVVKDTIANLGKMYLITNKHVLPQPNVSKTINIKAPYPSEKDSTFKEFDLDVYDKGNILSNHVKLHKNKMIDVAIIDVTEILMSKNIKINGIPSGYLLKNSDFEKYGIGLGDEVFVLGYPSSIYDKRTAKPIIRQGIISSNPRRDFYFNELLTKKNSTLPNPLNGFLIDGSIFPGSSGSLVLLKTSYELTDPKEFTFTKKANYVLGIISSTFVNNNNQSIAIGLAFSSECIVDLLKEFH